MAFRVILIENEVALKVKLNNLIVTKKGEEFWIPLEDISMIVLDNLSTEISARLLCQLTEQGIGLVICNQMHLPTGYYSSYDNHSRSSKVIGYQIEKDRHYYGTLWKRIVEAKINNQATAYLKMKCDKKGYEQIVQFSTSLEGYVECDNDLLSGISIFGDVDFQMPSFEKIKSFIYDNYPCHKNISEYQIYNDLKHIIQRIGQQESLLSVEELVICKLVNQTLMLHEKWRDSISEPEIAFLKSPNVLK